MSGLGEILYGVGCAGTAAVMTCTIVHPIDVVKTRVQINKAATVPSTVRAVYSEGVFAFWKGISAAWMREGSYTSLRLGLYKPIKQAVGADKKDAPFVLKVFAGGIAGALGSLVGNPFDLMKTKMMATSTGKPNFLTIFGEVWRKEGVTGFYRGLDANVSRAVVNNGTKMATYDGVKQLIRQSGVFGEEGFLMQAASSFTTAFVLTCAISPFDMIRTQLMNQPSEGPKLYKGMIDCGLALVKDRGVLSLWTGFFPLWFRVAPNAMIQLILFEQITILTGGKTL